MLTIVKENPEEHNGTEDTKCQVEIPFKGAQRRPLDSTVITEILKQYNPSAVLINSELQIVYSHGDTSPFLNFASGCPNYNILNMIREEIAGELKNAILLSRKEKKNTLGGYNALEHHTFLTSFEVVYLPSYEDHYLIIFHKTPLPSRDDMNLNEFKKEWKATNEEPASDANEVQPAQEILTISETEIESRNIELSALTEELQYRSNAFYLMRNLYETALNTMRQPMLVIDKKAVVSSANSSFYNFFKTNHQETLGISIFELGNHHWNIPEFKEAVLKKLFGQETVENLRIEFNLDGKTKKTMILNASKIPDSKPDGMICIALEDITELENSEQCIENKNLEIASSKKHLEQFTAAARNSLLEPVNKIHMFGKKNTGC